MNENKEHELLGLYRLLIDLKEEYQVSDDILKKQKTLGSIRDVIEEINLLVEEIEEENETIRLRSLRNDY